MELMHENSVGLYSATNPKPKGNPPSNCSSKSNQAKGRAFVMVTSSYDYSQGEGTLTAGMVFSAFALKLFWKGDGKGHEPHSTVSLLV